MEKKDVGANEEGVLAGRKGCDASLSGRNIQKGNVASGG